MAKSKWSRDDFKIRIFALKHYCQMTPTEVATSVGRTPIYINQMASGRVTITKRTEEAVRKGLRRKSKELLSQPLIHPAQGPVLTAISAYLKELSEEES